MALAFKENFKISFSLIMKAVVSGLDCLYLTDLKNVIMNGVRQIVSYYNLLTGQNNSTVTLFTFE